MERHLQSSQQDSTGYGHADLVVVMRLLLVICNNPISLLEDQDEVWSNIHVFLDPVCPARGKKYEIQLK